MRVKQLRETSQYALDVSTQSGTAVLLFANPPALTFSMALIGWRAQCLNDPA